ncbi:hypothetical protein DR864_03840 [Runella rosea]|uniref:7TM diverse intracellular signalling n=1 Tax=Runella rosea TaxID=2259595 RepID=A0A344TE52_9BACT|nr:histidine kinase [Runella rosea]AXE16923.1 hypothetical protein DR864_03840 [Runella rosea]
MKHKTVPRLCRWTLIFFFFANITHAQFPAWESPAARVFRLNNVDSITQPVFIGHFMAFWKKSPTQKTVFEAIKYAPFVNTNTQQFAIDSLKDIAFIRFSIQNTHPKDTLKMMLEVDGQNHFYLKFESFTGDWQPTQNAPLHEVPLQKFMYEKFAFPLSLPPNTGHIYWLNHDDSLFPIDFIPTLISAPAIVKSQNEQMYAQRFNLGFLWFVLGVSVFLSVFGYIMFFLNKQAIYLWWGCYLSCNALFFLMMSDYLFVFPQLPFIGLIIPVQHLILLCYVLFFSTFFNFKTNAPFLHKATVGLCFCIVFLLVVTVVLVRLFPETWSDFIDDRLFFIVQFWFLAVLISSFFLKIPQKSYIVCGSICLIVFSIWAVCIDTFGQTDYDSLLTTPACIYGIGFLFELLFLSLALSERAKFEQKDKLDIKRKMEEERIHFHHQIAQTEIVALRAQMNPHFIFNCLNSIQLYTIQNNTEKATEYLTKFSRLIRLVLENSRSEKVTLENELETLRLYLDMETMRFRGKVKYKIYFEATIDQTYIQIPPLLVQPFVENAIWHGLMHKDEGGTVRIEVTQPNPHLLRIDISDDGIGRQKAAEFKSKSATQNKSFGMKVTAERIALINQLYNTNNQVEIIDLINRRNEVVGTKVTVKIPI